MAFFYGRDGCIVVKRERNPREREISAIAGEDDIGPRQHDSLDGFLTEQFLEGGNISEILNNINKGINADIGQLQLNLKDSAKMRAIVNNRQPQPDLMDEIPKRKLTHASLAYLKKIGEDLGVMLKRLHDHDIIYNNSILGDHMTPGHLILTEDGVRLCDFGYATDLNYELTDTDLFNITIHENGRLETLARYTLEDERKVFIKKVADKYKGYRTMFSAILRDELKQQDVRRVYQEVARLSALYKTDFMVLSKAFKKSYSPYIAKEQQPQTDHQAV